MSKFNEQKIIRCRYGKEQPVIDEYVAFGWFFSSKQLLNRFGNPLPIGTNLDEKTLREKCYYDLTFSREVEKEDVAKLESLQTEYSGLKLRQTCFTGKRVTSCVFLTLFLIAFIIMLFMNDLDEKTKIVALVLTIITALGLAAVITTGILGVFKNGNMNKMTLERRAQIEKETKEILLNNK